MTRRKIAVRLSWPAWWGHRGDREENVMSRTSQATTTAETESAARARRRAQEAVQEAMDRRDNGGDSVTITDN
jgi:hypothetical protein